MAITTSRYALFNNWNFNSVPGLSVYAITPPGQQNKTLNISELANSNRRKVTSAFYQAHTMTINVYITANSRELLEQALDTLYTNIQAQEGALVVPTYNGTRQYTATYSSSSINNTMSNSASPASNYVDLTLIFECSDSYGYDINYTLITNSSGVTATPMTINFTQGGSAEWQTPFIQVNILALTGSGAITVGNQNTGQSITVSAAFAVNDLLQIDCRNKTVQLDNTDIAFTGAFPEFNTGPQTLYYSDTLTTRTINLFAYVYNRYN